MQNTAFDRIRISFPLNLENPVLINESAIDLETIKVF
jgi:hypothetical protein